MKLLVATGVYFPDIGGPATYSKILYDELPKQGINVKILSFERVKQYPRGVRHFLYFLLVFFYGMGSDIIYAQDPISTGFPASLAARILHKPFYLKIVGDFAWEQGVLRFNIKDSLDDFSVNKSKYNIFVRMLKRVEKYTAKTARKIIVPSNYLKKIATNWGVDNKKIKVIYNSFSPPQNIPKSKKEEDIILFTSGRLVPWKGFKELIAYMPKLIHKYKNIRLIIAGDGPRRQELTDEINKSKLKNYIKLVGRLSKEEIYKKIRNSQIFILNTKYEGFSHQLLEVMYLGTPIITTNIGGNPELIVNNESGILVSPNNEKEIFSAISKIISDVEFTKKIKNNAHEKAKQFSQNNMIDKLIRELK